jgi:hypothetical protein
VIEGGYAIGGDQNEPFILPIRVTDLALVPCPKLVEMRFPYRVVELVADGASVHSVLDVLK